MDSVDEASHGDTQQDEVTSSPVILRHRAPMSDTAGGSLEPPLRDSTSHLSSGSLGSPTKIRPCSVIASKNTRKRMEDRHVVLHDLKAYLPSALQSKVDPEEHVSYYAVFDGHAGTDAASYAASNLHELLVGSSHYPSNPAQAFTDAFLTCDKDFTASSKKSGTTAVCALLKGNHIYLAWLGDSIATLVREGVTVKIMDSHKPNRDDEKSRVEALGGTVILWGTWRVNGQLAVSRAIGDGEYKPFVTAEPDITTIVRNGTEDFIIVACDGLWDTVTPEEATGIVINHLKENQTREGDLDNLAAKLATVAKEKGSSDNITIIVILLKSVQELVVPPLVPDQVEGRDTPHSHGITSTSDYVFRVSAGSGRSSTEPNPGHTEEDPLPSPTVKFDSSGHNGVGCESGGVFSPHTAFSLGNGFDMEEEQFNTNPEEIRLSNGSSTTDERISGVELLNGDDGLDQEMLKKQSIDKVDDLLKMLDREDEDSPNPEDDVDGGLSLDEVLARARDRGDTEDCEEDSGETSEEEDIVTDFPNINGGNNSLGEVLGLEESRLRYEERRRQLCEQVLVVETGPEECGMVVPPSEELPSQQQAELLSVMSCSMVVELEERNGDRETQEETGEPGEAGELLDNMEEETTSGFMLKTPGETEQKLSNFDPEKERETSVDTGECVMEPATNTTLDSIKDETQNIVTESSHECDVQASPGIVVEIIPESLSPPENMEVEPSEGVVESPTHTDDPGGLAIPQLQITPATPTRGLSPRTSIGETEAPSEQFVQSVQITEDDTEIADPHQIKTEQSSSEPKAVQEEPPPKVTAAEGESKKVTGPTKTSGTASKTSTKPSKAGIGATKGSVTGSSKSSAGVVKSADTSRTTGVGKTSGTESKAGAASRPTPRPAGASAGAARTAATAGGAGGSTVGARPKAPVAGASKSVPPKKAGLITGSKPGDGSEKQTSSSSSSSRPISKPSSRVTPAPSRVKPGSESSEPSTKTASTSSRPASGRPLSSAASATESTATPSVSAKKLPNKTARVTPKTGTGRTQQTCSVTSVSRTSTTAPRPNTATTRPKSSSTTASSTVTKTRQATVTNTNTSATAKTSTSSTARSKPTPTTTDRTGMTGRTPAKPSEAATRVAAARAAAKAPKPTATQAVKKTATNTNTNKKTEYKSEQQTNESTPGNQTGPVEAVNPTVSSTEESLTRVNGETDSSVPTEIIDNVTNNAELTTVHNEVVNGVDINDQSEC